MPHQKKLFKHGGSYAVDLPVSFVRELASKIVYLEQNDDQVVIASKEKLDTIEREPEFKIFVAALLQDALRRPSKLKDTKEVWDSQWDDLLKDAAR